AVRRQSRKRDLIGTRRTRRVTVGPEESDAVAFNATRADAAGKGERQQAHKQDAGHTQQRDETFRFVHFFSLFMQRESIIAGLTFSAGARPNGLPTPRLLRRATPPG